MDYAAAPIQPIVQGLVTFPAGVGTAPVFEGKGVSSIIRGPLAQGWYILTLDAGLPGNAGAVPPGAVPFFDPDVRTMITPRGVGVPPVSGIATRSVSYLPSIVPGVGANRVQVVLTDNGLVPTDPVRGFEIIVWKGVDV